MSHSLGISKNFTAHQNKTSSQYQSLEELTVYNMITINSLICLMIYILKLRAQNLPVWNNSFPHIRKPLHNRQISPRGSFLKDGQ